MKRMIDVLVVSGSMGSGKTTVMAEASDLLAAAGIVHAAIDSDALAIGHFPTSPFDLHESNFTSLWQNYASAGIAKLLIAEALDTSTKRDQIMRVIPDASLSVCRLRARIETMEARVRQREPGMLQPELVARVAALESSLDSTRIADFEVDNDGRPVTAVARDMLRLAGWL
jgi:predicted kinase